MPVSLRTAVDTSLPAVEALAGLLRPGEIPGRRILRHDPAEVIYEEGGEITTHLVLLKAYRDARNAWAKDAETEAAEEAGEDLLQDDGDRLNGHVVGPFGEVWFTLRAIQERDRTRVELEGSYEPKGLLLRMAPKRSARQLTEEFQEGLKLALARQEGRLEEAVRVGVEKKALPQDAAG